MSNRKAKALARLAEKEAKKPFSVKWIILTAVITLLLAGAAIYFIFFFRTPYPSIPQTEKEAEVVLTIGELPVSYDLYRYFFLGNKNTVDTEGLTDSDAFLRVHNAALRDLSEFLAVYEIGKTYSVTPESDSVKAMYQELMLATRYGGESFGYRLSGFASQEQYAAYLAERCMSDAVYRKMMEEIAVDYYTAAAFSETAKDTVGLSKEDVLAFFRDDSLARRMTFCYIPINQYIGMTYEDAYTSAKALAESAYRALADCRSDADFINKAIGHTLPGSVSEASIENGIYRGRYDSDNSFRPVIDALFSIEIGENSGLIETAEGFFIIRRLSPKEDYLTADENDVTLRTGYLTNKFYQLVAEKAERMREDTVLSGILLTEPKSLDLID